MNITHHFSLMKKKGFLVLLFALSIFASVFWQVFYPHIPIGGDAETYDMTAQAINQQGIIKGFQSMGQFISRPFYPLFLAGIYYLFGHNYIAVIIIQLLLTICTVFLVFYITDSIFGYSYAKLSSILMVLFPSNWVYSGILMREILTVFLLTLLVLLLYKIQNNNSHKPLFWVAALTAFLTLTNPIFKLLIYCIACYGFFIFSKKSSWKSSMLKVLFLFLVFFIIARGWGLIENEVPKSKFMGDSPGFYLMDKYERMKKINNKFFTYFISNALGDYFAYAYDPSFDNNSLRQDYPEKIEYAKLLENQSSEEVDKIFLKKSLNNIIRHPILLINDTILTLLKFDTPMIPIASMKALFANTHPNIPGFIKASVIIAIRAVYYFFLAVIFYTVVKKRKEFGKIGWMLLIILYLHVLYIPLYSIARYALPLYPFYIILFSVGILEIIKNKFPQFRPR